MSKEPVTVIGEVWGDIQLGRVTFPRQRIVVIKNMATVQQPYLAQMIR